MYKNKTKKKKDYNKKLKKDMWSSFEKSFKNEDENMENRIECLYVVKNLKIGHIVNYVKIYWRFQKMVS